MTAREKQSLGAAVQASPCAWRTGDRHCLIRPTGKYCQWHQTWMRLVDVGALGDGQAAAFVAWWEQFQPTGIYAENPGPWWADVAMLWASLIGLEEPPNKTNAISTELYVRRAEVQRYLIGLPIGETPWARVHGLPLPAWITEEWQTKVDAQRVRTKEAV